VQYLSPGMEHGKEAEFGAEVLGIGADYASPQDNRVLAVDTHCGKTAARKISTLQRLHHLDRSLT
jgi:hypothetical protein